MLSQMYLEGTGKVQVKSLCSVVQKASDNIAGKNPVQCCLKTLGTTLHK